MKISPLILLYLTLFYIKLNVARDNAIQSPFMLSPGCNLKFLYMFTLIYLLLMKGENYIIGYIMYISGLADDS